MTERAVDHVKREMKKSGTALGFRLGTTRTGCSGLAYVVDFAERVNDDDLAFPVDDELTVYVDPKSFEVVRGTRIDFVRNGLNRLFKFENPNLKGECGCGESFTV
jgi:iron-sulfur cluster assembly protein